jgi:hypothetical protein
MSSHRYDILNPVGDAFTHDQPNVPAAPSVARAGGAIGLLNNSKPNVSHFMHALAQHLRTTEREIISVTKPRSAGPSPNIAYLVDRCEFVINAVGD